MTTIGHGAEAWHNVVRSCTARDCAQYLPGVRDGLRRLDYRW